MSKFPRLSPDEAKLLGESLETARKYWAKLLPHDSQGLQTRIVRLQMRLTPWLTAKQLGGHDAD
jgi:hypothetical protein